MGRRSLGFSSFLIFLLIVSTGQVWSALVDDPDRVQRDAAAILSAMFDPEPRVVFSLPFSVPLNSHEAKVFEQVLSDPRVKALVSRKEEILARARATYSTPQLAPLGRLRDHLVAMERRGTPWRNLTEIEAESRTRSTLAPGVGNEDWTRTIQEDTDTKRRFQKGTEWRRGDLTPDSSKRAPRVPKDFSTWFQEQVAQAHIESAQNVLPAFLELGTSEVLFAHNLMRFSPAPSDAPLFRIWLEPSRRSPERSFRIHSFAGFQAQFQYRTHRGWTAVSTHSMAPSADVRMPVGVSSPKQALAWLDRLVEDLRRTHESAIQPRWRAEGDWPLAFLWHLRSLESGPEIAHAQTRLELLGRPRLGDLITDRNDAPADTFAKNRMAHFLAGRADLEKQMSSPIFEVVTASPKLRVPTEFVVPSAEDFAAPTPVSLPASPEPSVLSLRQVGALGSGSGVEVPIAPILRLNTLVVRDPQNAIVPPSAYKVFENQVTGATWVESSGDERPDSWRVEASYARRPQNPSPNSSGLTREEVGRIAKAASEGGLTVLSTRLRERGKNGMSLERFGAILAETGTYSFTGDGRRQDPGTLGVGPFIDETGRLCAQCTHFAGVGEKLVLASGSPWKPFVELSRPMLRGKLTRLSHARLGLAHPNGQRIVLDVTPPAPISGRFGVGATGLWRGMTARVRFLWERITQARKDAGLPENPKERHAPSPFAEEARNTALTREEILGRPDTRKSMSRDAALDLARIKSTALSLLEREGKVPQDPTDPRRRIFEFISDLSIEGGSLELQARIAKTRTHLSHPKIKHIAPELGPLFASLARVVDRMVSLTGSCAHQVSSRALSQ